jgi:chemotaxis signal transduction protein
VHRRLLLFRLGHEWHALPREAVSDVIDYVRPRPVDVGAECARGVIAVRGRMVTIHDLAVSMRLTASAPSRILILHGAAGITVDSVEGIATVAPGDVVPPPPGAGPAAVGLVRCDARRPLLLDPDELLRSLARPAA